MATNKPISDGAINKGGRPRRYEVLPLEQSIKKDKGLIMWVVNKFALKFGGGVAELDELKKDLYAEGVMGYITAYNKFDAKKGVKLSSYAYMTVFNRVQAATALLFPCMKCPNMEIKNERYGFSLDDLVTEQEHVFLAYDPLIEDDLIDKHPVEDYLYHVTPAQADALRMEYGIITESEFPRLAPMRKFLVKTGMDKLKNIKDKVRYE